MKKAIRIIAIILVIIGISVSIYPMVSNYVVTKQGLEAIVNYNSKVQDYLPDEIDLEYQKVVNYNNGVIDENEYENVLNINEDGIMGFLEIPKIGIKLPIFHGTENSNMSKGVGHIKTSSLPSVELNTHAVLTSHTGYATVKLFNDLDNLKIDDEFFVSILDKEIKYKVVDINVVLPNDTEKIKVQENRNLVTLITCTPYGKNTHRLLVTGELDRENNIEENEETIEKIKTYYNNEYIIYILIAVFLLGICVVLILKLS